MTIRARSTLSAIAITALLLSAADGEARRRGFQRGVTVAIDGPSGVGKSTTAKMVAQRLGYTFVDTGACYRALALQAKQQGVDLKDQKQLTRLARKLPISFHNEGRSYKVRLAGKDVSAAIRAPEISRGASIVAAHPKVRSQLVALQRKLAGKGGAVLEGRDIGTNVCPKAKVKFFLTAAPEERARRHHESLLAKGKQVSFSDVLKQIKDRDLRDRNRTVDPLRPAKDAIILDTTKITLDQVVDNIVAQAQRK